MDQLVYTLPDGVYLNKIDQKAQLLTLSGVAQSNARVSAYMRNIDTSQWMAKPKLDVIETVNSERRRSAEFVLRASQATSTPSEESGEEQS
jgi:type IV pilus assembly protein PilN